MLRRLQAAPRWSIAVLALLLIALAGIADWFSGREVGFTAIYLLPISLTAWLLGRQWMLAAALLCGASWLLVNVASNQFAEHAAVETVNLLLALGIFLLFGQLLVSLRRQLLVEQQLARTDPLTGLSNRRAFWSAAGQELERCRRFGQPFSIAYIDIDDFKGVNDRLGHRAGDELLAAIGSTLQRGIRRVDTAARIGGDEFALLLPGTDARGAEVLLDKVRELLQGGLRATFGVGCSVGCLSVLEPLADVDELVARADAMMYAAKRGRGEPVQHAVFPAPRGGGARRHG